MIGNPSRHQSMPNGAFTMTGGSQVVWALKLYMHILEYNILK